VNSQAAL